MKNEAFNEYVEVYKKLPLAKKKEKVNEEIKRLLAFIAKMNEDINLNSDMLLNREILDLNHENVSDEDFVEAIFVYIHVIEESLGRYFNEISKILYK